MQVERRLTRRELAALGSFAAQRPIDPSESEAERLKTVANVSAMKTQTTTIVWTWRSLFASPVVTFLHAIDGTSPFLPPSAVALRMSA